MGPCSAASRLGGHGPRPCIGQKSGCSRSAERRADQRATRDQRPAPSTRERLGGARRGACCHVRGAAGAWGQRAAVGAGRASVWPGGTSPARRVRPGSRASAQRQCAAAIPPWQLPGAAIRAARRTQARIDARPRTQPPGPMSIGAGTGMQGPTLMHTHTARGMPVGACHASHVRGMHHVFLGPHWAALAPGPRGLTTRADMCTAAPHAPSSLRMCVGARLCIHAQLSCICWPGAWMHTYVGPFAPASPVCISIPLHSLSPPPPPPPPPSSRLLLAPLHALAALPASALLSPTTHTIFTQHTT